MMAGPPKSYPLTGHGGITVIGGFRIGQRVYVQTSPGHRLPAIVRRIFKKYVDVVWDAGDDDGVQARVMQKDLLGPAPPKGWSRYTARVRVFFKGSTMRVEVPDLGEVEARPQPVTWSTRTTALGPDKRHAAQSMLAAIKKVFPRAESYEVGAIRRHKDY